MRGLGSLEVIKMIDKVIHKTAYNKLVKLYSFECPVCHEFIHPSDHKEAEYIKTSRGTEIFIHTKCVKHWGDKN